MPILNYTTTIDTNKTLGEIQRVLVRAGARQTAAEFDDQARPVGLAFAVETPEGMRRFALPANADGVYAALRREKVPKRFQTVDQAHRVAWRILKDWVEAQMAIHEAGLARLDQIMMPYMLVGPGSETMWDRYLDNQLAIGPGE